MTGLYDFLVDVPVWLVCLVVGLVCIGTVFAVMVLACHGLEHLEQRTELELARRAGTARRHTRPSGPAPIPPRGSGPAPLRMVGPGTVTGNDRAPGPTGGAA